MKQPAEGTVVCIWPIEHLCYTWQRVSQPERQSMTGGPEPQTHCLILREHTRLRCSVSPRPVSANLTGKDNSLIQTEHLCRALGLVVRGYRGVELSPLDKSTRAKRS